MKKIRKPVRFMRGVAVCVVLLVCCLLLSSCAVVREKTKYDAISLFRKNQAYFEEVIEPVISQDGIFDTLDILSRAESIDVPKELSDIGIKEIFSADKNVYFAFSDEIMGVTPYGIVYAMRLQEIDEWYKTEQIEGNWYYYRIVS